MNNNKKLSRKVKHVFPLALAAALTITGTGVTTSAQTASNIRVNRIAVLAQETAGVITTSSEVKIIKIAKDAGDENKVKYQVSNDGADWNTPEKKLVPEGGITIKGNEAETRIIVDELTEVKINLEDYTTSLSSEKWLTVAANAKVELNLKGTNKVTGNIGLAATDDLTVKGEGSLELGVLTAKSLNVKGGNLKLTGAVTNTSPVTVSGGKLDAVSTISGDVTVTGGMAKIADAITGKLTVNGDAVVHYKSATSKELNKGVVYEGTKGLIYGDPQVGSSFDKPADSKLGVNVDKQDITDKADGIIRTAEVTGEDLDIADDLKEIKVKRNALDGTVTLKKGTDYNVEVETADKKNAGEKVLKFTMSNADYAFATDVTNAIKIKLVNKDLKNAKIAFDNGSSFKYDGTNRTVKFSVKEKDVVLKEDTDFTVTNENSKKKTAKDAGKYTLELVGKGNYAGSTISASWEITPIKIKVKKLKVVKDYDGKDTITAADVKTAEFEGFLESEKEALKDKKTFDAEGKFDSPAVGEKKSGKVKLTLKEDLKNYTVGSEDIKFVDGEIKNKKPDKPAKPTLKGTYKVSETNEKTFVATLNGEAGQEYRMDGGKWQSSPTFDGIKPGNHTFGTRVAAKDGNVESDEEKSDEIDFKQLDNTNKIALNYTLADGAKKNTKKIIINKVKGAEYKFGNGIYSDNNVQDELSNTETAYKVYIRYKETDTMKAGDAVEESVNLTKTTLSDKAPKLEYTVVAGTHDGKVKYIIKSPETLKGGKTYQYRLNNENWVNSADFDNLTVGEKNILSIRIVDGAGNASPATSKEVTVEKAKAPKLKLDYTVTTSTNKVGKKITIKEQPAVEGLAGNVNYSVEAGNSLKWGTAEENRVVDNYMLPTIKIGIKYVPATNSTAYEENANIVELRLNGNNGVVAYNGTETKKDETKKPEDKKDTKKDETKKPEDKKDNTNTDNKTPAPADTSKAIKDAVKKSTKTGSVTLKSVGSGLEKAVGGNTSKLSVSLNKSKTKSTSKAVTKKLGKSKLVTKTVYSFNIKNGSKNLTDKQVSGSKINVTLKVSLGNKNRTVYVMDVSTGKKVKAKYNAKTKKLTFTTKYVGDFVIVK
ncbi:MAG: hypothetical protein ACTTG8_00990 [Catonella sp.]|uniref:hypothetical protein n=1 Tax=Catonella sp. TaxID=2382125 RepID=UPI003FA127CE